MTQRRLPLSLDIILDRCDPALKHHRARAAYQVAAYLMRFKPFICPREYKVPLHHEAAWDHYQILLHEHQDFHLRVVACLTSHLQNGMESFLGIADAEDTDNVYGYCYLHIYPVTDLALSGEEKKMLQLWERKWKASKE